MWLGECLPQGERVHAAISWPISRPLEEAGLHLGEVTPAWSVSESLSLLFLPSLSPPSFCPHFLLGSILKFSFLILMSVSCRQGMARRGRVGSPSPGSLPRQSMQAAAGRFSAPPRPGRPSRDQLSHRVLFYVFLYFDKTLSAGERNSPLSK